MSEIVGYAVKKSVRILTPSEARMRVMKTGKYLSIPKDHAKWKPSFLEKNSLRPVYRGKEPEYNHATQRLTGRVARSVDGKLVETWKVVSRFDSIEQEREAAIRHVKSACERAWRSGRVVVDGVPYRTDEKGIALLGTTTYYNRKNRHIVAGNDVFERTPVQLREAKKQCDAFVQACFDRAAELIDAIKGSDDPFGLDLESGWPE